MIDALWPILLLLPLLGAYLTLMWPARAEAIATSAAGANALLVTLLAWHVSETGPLQHILGGWAPPLGIALRLDGAAAILLLTSAWVALAATLYARAYLAVAHAEPRDQSAPPFWPLWLFLLAALNALFMAGDLFNLYVTLELTSLAAVALVTLGGGRAGVAAALRYLLVGLLGSLLFLFGVGLVYAAQGSVDLLQLSRMEGGDAVMLGALLMSMGLLFKAGLFPFHFWLPPAHGKAPAPVSAMLSAVVVEAAFYLLLRIWTQLVPVSMAAVPLALLAGLGVVAVFWGGLNALRTERLKLMVAYSTVAQLGYLFLALPLLHAGHTESGAWVGILLLVLAHGVAKGAMFLAAGTVLQVAGHDRIEALAGLAQRLPMTMATLGLAAVSLIGLPPSGGFLAKWLLLNSAIATGAWWAVATLLGGSLLAGAYLFRLLGHAFANHADARPTSLSLPRFEWPALALAVLVILLGLAGSWPAELALSGAPVSGPMLFEAYP